MTLVFEVHLFMMRVPEFLPSRKRFLECGSSRKWFLECGQSRKRFLESGPSRKRIRDCRSSRKIITQCRPSKNRTIEEWTVTIPQLFMRIGTSIEAQKLLCTWCGRRGHVEKSSCNWKLGLCLICGGKHWMTDYASFSQKQIFSLTPLMDIKVSTVPLRNR